MPSARDFADECRRALERCKETPQEHFERMVEHGLINRQGQVTRIIGGSAEPDASHVPREQREAAERARQQYNKSKYQMTWRALHPRGYGRDAGST